LLRLNSKPVGILDNSKGYIGETFLSIPISAPQLFKGKGRRVRDGSYIVITTGEYESVVKQLIGYGLVPGMHFCCSPILNDLKLRKELQDYDSTLLVSSCDYNKKDHRRYSRAGGGLFLYNTKRRSIDRVYAGVFRQMEKMGDNILAVEHLDMALYLLSPRLKLLDKLPLDHKNANACGIAYWENGKKILVADASLDTIFLYDAEKFLLCETIPISHKSNTGQHHINDLCVIGDSLYVSYFSQSGNYKRGVLDGGISEINLNDTTKAPFPVISNLWMPHSIAYLDGNMCYCDSMRGAIYITSQNPAGVFPGFIRGIDFDGRFYFIGQSEPAYMSRLFGISNNIMMNAGIYIFDNVTKVSRFHVIPEFVNIHDVIMQSKVSCSGMPEEIE
jgi:hypothetical protein